MSILNRIRAQKVEEVASLRARKAEVEFAARARDMPPPRDFTGVIAARYAANQVALIAEIKKASPSRGMIRDHFDVAAIARAYHDGGAACLSVLTDERFFNGHRDFVSIASNASGLPVLRKDFIIDPIQVVEARSMQADAILLILAMLDDRQARELEAVAQEYNLHVLIEVHNEVELDRALAMSARLIGFNNRDLTTFEADLRVSERLVSRIDNGRFAISESGIGSIEDVERLLAGGVHGFLIGEMLMKAPDIEAATKSITSKKLNSGWITKR